MDQRPCTLDRQPESLIQKVAICNTAMNHISLAVDQLTVDLAPTKTITSKAGTLMAIGERAGQAELDAFKKVREGGDAAAIKTAMDQATQKIYEVFGKLYQSQEGQPNPGDYTQEGPQTNPDGSVDVEGDVH